jgi:hypothetical protein
MFTTAGCVFLTMGANEFRLGASLGSASFNVAGGLLAASNSRANKKPPIARMDASANGAVFDFVIFRIVMVPDAFVSGRRSIGSNETDVSGRC